MRWSRIKNIIILLLVIVNVSLLAMVGAQKYRAVRGERETRRQMVAVLEKNGISYLPGEVPGELELPGQQVTPELGGDEAAACFLSPGEWQVDTDGERFASYTGDGAGVTFLRGGGIYASYTALTGPRLDEEGGGAALLEGLGVRVRETGREMGPGDTVTVRCVQLWNGAPVPGLEVELVYTEGFLTRVEGRLLRGKAESTAGGENITASTALARFLEAWKDGGYVCTQVTNLYAGYAASGTETVTLTPVWYIETETWPWRFVVDGATGTVSVEQ